MKKILSSSTLKRAVSNLRRRKKKIVFTNGTFDILHLGHVSYLQKARACGDVLIVGVNNDQSVKGYKGPKRPLNPQADRLKVLTALTCVDYAVLFGDPTPIKLIKAIRPNVLVKGADWKLKDIVGAGEVKGWRGKVKRVSFIKGKSTTRVLKKLGLA